MLIWNVDRLKEIEGNMKRTKEALKECIDNDDFGNLYDFHFYSLINSRGQRQEVNLILRKPIGQVMSLKKELDKLRKQKDLSYKEKRIKLWEEIGKTATKLYKVKQEVLNQIHNIF